MINVRTCSFSVCFCSVLIWGVWFFLEWIAHKCIYPGCGKVFSRGDNLHQHTRVHRGYSAVAAAAAAAAFASTSTSSYTAASSTPHHGTTDTANTFEQVFGYGSLPASSNMGGFAVGSGTGTMRRIPSVLLSGEM